VSQKIDCSVLCGRCFQQSGPRCNSVNTYLVARGLGGRRQALRRQVLQHALPRHRPRCLQGQVALPVRASTGYVAFRCLLACLLSADDISRPGASAAFFPTSSAPESCGSGCIHAAAVLHTLAPPPAAWPAGQRTVHWRTAASARRPGCRWWCCRGPGGPSPRRRCGPHAARRGARHAWGGAAPSGPCPGCPLAASCREERQPVLRHSASHPIPASPLHADALVTCTAPGGHS
jgi:hypothetical protein